MDLFFYITAFSSLAFIIVKSQTKRKTTQALHPSIENEEFETIKIKNKSIRYHIDSIEATDSTATKSKAVILLPDCDSKTNKKLLHTLFKILGQQLNIHRFSAYTDRKALEIAYRNAINNHTDQCYFDRFFIGVYEGISR